MTRNFIEQAIYNEIKPLVLAGKSVQEIATYCVDNSIGILLAKNVYQDIMLEIQNEVPRKLFN